MLSDWLTAREFNSYVGISDQTRCNWCNPKMGCVYLGRPVRTEPVRPGSTVRKYSRADAETIKYIMTHGEDRTGQLTVDEAFAEFGFPRSELESWHRNGCPWKGGEKLGQFLIVPEEMRNGGHARWLHFFRVDLEEIRDRMNGVSTTAETTPCGRYEQAKELGLSRYEVDALVRDGKVERRKEPTRLSHGRPFPVNKFPLDQLQQAAERKNALRNGTTLRDDILLGRDAAAVLGVDINRLYDWRDNGCCYLLGEKLRGEQVEAFVANPSHPNVRDLWAFDKAQILRIAEYLGQGQNAPYKDEEGTWLPARLAQRRHLSHPENLRIWRDNPCTFLDGRTIKAKQVPNPAQTKHGGLMWVYLESDLKEIAKRRVERFGLASFTDGEGTWLFASAVQERYGLPADNLWYYRTKDFPALPDGKIRAKRVSSALHPYFYGQAVGEMWAYLDADLKALEEGNLLSAIDAPAESMPGAESRNKGARDENDRLYAAGLEATMTAGFYPSARQELREDIRQELAPFREELSVMREQVARLQVDIYGRTPSAGGFGVPFAAEFLEVGQDEIHGMLDRRELASLGKDENGELQICPRSMIQLDMRRREQPRWDENCRTLYLGDRIMKRFNHGSAVAQIDLIEAFHLKGWPAAIENPFSDTPGKLNQTMAALNGSLPRPDATQPKSTMRFRGDGTGEGVFWEVV